ncbi:hypothetical protein F5883DRAFT_718597 [Diaporthe sp. PMI_573]|nr:hypothetical protein F5883DRAFT_718597 [Diaporthaceae sp. PMI_573]
MFVNPRLRTLGIIRQLVNAENRDAFRPAGIARDTAKDDGPVYYVTNYATKVEDPTWKRVAAAAELLPAAPTADRPAAGKAARGGGIDGVAEDGDGDATKNKTRQFLTRVANRVFTERPLSQVEVVAHLLGYPVEFTNSRSWAYLNVSLLYWHVFRRWRHLRHESGAVDSDALADESVVIEEAGQKISFAEA